jgi:hypothetical protein
MDIFVTEHPGTANMLAFIAEHAARGGAAEVEKVRALGGARAQEYYCTSQVVRGGEDTSKTGK